jgi:hypothetical protein
VQQNLHNGGWEETVTREEQKNITCFIELAVKSDAGAADTALDVEADAIIRALFVRNPEAAYRITMLAMSQAEQLAELTTALSEERNAARGNWLSRLPKRPEPLQRRARRDPHLPVLVENTRIR